MTASFILKSFEKKNNDSLVVKEDKIFSNEQNKQDEHWHETHPNSVLIPIGRIYISWHSDSGVAVLALIILILLCCVAIMVCLLSSACTDRTWSKEFLNILGQGIVATSGAVVGSGATTRIKKRK